MQQLQQMIAIPSTLPGLTADAQVTLNILQGLDVIPDVVAFDNPSFDFISLVGTTLTVINRGAAEATTNVWLIYFHSIERSYGPLSVKQLNPAPFVIRGAGGDTSTEVVAKMIFDQASQEVLDNGTLVLDWETATYESPVGVVDLVNGQFVVPISGTYIITAMVTWEAFAANGSFRLTVGIDGAGSGTAQQSVESNVDNNVSRSNVVSTAMQLSAGKLVTFIVNQLTGAARDVLFGEATISRVGPGGPIGPIIM